MVLDHSVFIASPFIGKGTVRGITGVQPLVVMNRRLFEQKISYQEAKTFMEKGRHLSPAYYILGGVDGNEGSIVTTAGMYGYVHYGRK